MVAPFLDMQFVMHLNLLIKSNYNYQILKNNSAFNLKFINLILIEVQLWCSEQGLGTTGLRVCLNYLTSDSVEVLSCSRHMFAV